MLTMPNNSNNKIDPYTVRHNSESGFTLVEVAIAIALLGLGLMTLTALSVRLMNDTQEEANRIRASFYAQYLLEVFLADRQAGNNNANNDSQNKSTGSLYSKLQEINYFDDLENIDEFKHLENWNYNFDTENITLPFTTSSLDKYKLVVSWGREANQEFSVETIKKSKDTGQTTNNNNSPNSQAGSSTGTSGAAGSANNG